MIFIGVPLVGRRSSRFRISYEANGESTLYKEGWIKQIFGSGDRVNGWSTPDRYSCIMRAPIDMDSSGCDLI